MRQSRVSQLEALRIYGSANNSLDRMSDIIRDELAATGLVWLVVRLLPIVGGSGRP